MKIPHVGNNDFLAQLQKMHEQAKVPANVEIKNQETVERSNPIANSKIDVKA